ncbi:MULTISPECIES: flavodoxin family protein [unclassified Salipiger]|uniref:flavodoxin family protein n=1 Tax=unclassified Salipiger TaxID=2640570 RepID=UPI0013B9F8C4|nr:MULTISPECIES: NAD(P)H-dependent oxidoreductase [unclassified Salipiger]NDV52562.1 flavodoxin family protein [Salipiger sp. PrR003]NDW32731.1 flavodoxin family protein [Salipiger sp. PrR007]
MSENVSAFAITCSLRRSGEGKPGSTDRMVEDLFKELRDLGVSCDSAHAADFNIMPGVSSDEGPDDDWPWLRDRLLSADIFVLGTPVWLGQPSSIAKRVLERMDAFLGEADELGRMPALGKVGLACVVGNEDGAHACHAALFQALIDVGFTIPGNAGCYWVGEAMGSVDYADHPAPPEKIAQSLKLAASNAQNLARYFRNSNFTGVA